MTAIVKLALPCACASLWFQAHLCFAAADEPIVAIFSSHQHTDHYNGASALLTPEPVAEDSVKTYAWDNYGLRQRRAWI